MNKILAHIDRITRNRDRMLLDVSIIQALAELTASPCINLYCVLEGPAGSAATLVARHDQAGLTCWTDDDPERPEEALADGTLLARCHQQRCEVTERRRTDGTRRHAFPLLNGEGMAGMLEFVLPRRLTQSERQLIHGFAALHRNFLALLDYSQIDALTGLLNRKTFDDNLDRILRIELPALAPGEGTVEGDCVAPVPQRRFTTADQPHWLAVIDIDHFKRINDRFGHLYGDEVLILLAKLMKESFRHFDKLFRFGGEEFIVVLKSVAEEKVGGVLDRFRNDTACHDFPQVGKVTVSIGYTRIAPGDPPAAIVGRADEALYFAKEHGRNQVRGYEVLVATGSLQPRQFNTEAELF
jgi:diguanylate cyclase (GGDEF)-like protein